MRKGNTHRGIATATACSSTRSGLAARPASTTDLYWPADVAKGEEMSPFGPLVAESAAYLKGRKAGDPYRGYHFRILTRQGKNAPGGAYSYVINGRMIAGFAMVAYPGAVRRERRDDVHRQPQRQNVREGHGKELRDDGSAIDRVRSGSRMARIRAMIIRATLTLLLYPAARHAVGRDVSDSRVMV